MKNLAELKSPASMIVLLRKRLSKLTCVSSRVSEEVSRKSPWKRAQNQKVWCRIDILISIGVVIPVEGNQSALNVIRYWWDLKVTDQKSDTAEELTKGEPEINGSMIKSQESRRL